MSTEPLDPDFPPLESDIELIARRSLTQWYINGTPLVTLLAGLTDEQFDRVMARERFMVDVPEGAVVNVEALPGTTQVVSREHKENCAAALEFFTTTRRNARTLHERRHN